MKRLGVLILLALITFSCPSCSQGDGDEAWQPQKSRVNPHIYLSETNQILYPDTAETRAIREAAAAVAEQCMAEQGFPGLPATRAQAGLLILPGNESDVELVYYYRSPENSRKYGVAAPGFHEGRHKRDYPPAISEDTQTVLNNCLDVVEKQIYGNLTKMQELEQQAMDINNSVDVADVQKSAEREWAKCMKGRGLGRFDAVAGIFGPTGDENGPEWPDPRPNPEEIRVAQASGECMIETGYLETVTRANAIAVHEELQKHPGVITEWKKIRQEQVEAAQELGKSPNKR